MDTNNTNAQLMEVAQRIRDMRDITGYSQEEMAQKQPHHQKTASHREPERATTTQAIRQSKLSALRLTPILLIAPNCCA